MSDLGLPPNEVWLCEYSSEWPVLFDHEKVRIMDAIGAYFLDIQHVGSTSIVGMKAKPIIDIMLGVKQLSMGLELVRPLEAIGYRYLTQQVVVGHHVFAKGAAITHLLHVVEYLGPQWKRLLTFRELLRSQPDIGARYEAEKARLSIVFATNRIGYSAAKEPLIDGILGAVPSSPPL
jgi:GrpB-like predicted nucleotidyltransferase (UPF0157 family)